MSKLTVNQVAQILEVSPYTVKRWYKWYEEADIKELDKLAKGGMPGLPKYETVGPTKWRYWDEADVEQLIAFSNWVPHTRNGVFKKVLENKEVK